MFPADPIVAGALKSPWQLFDILGSFWRDYLSDRDLLRYHEFAKLQLHADVYLRAVELAAAGSIQTVTPFVARQWRLIRLLESELTQDPNKIRYGSGRVYGDGLVYGQLQDQSFVWVLDEDIREIGLLVDHVVNPAHVFDISNCQFDATTNELRFGVNPFTSLAPLPVYDDAGAIVDRQVLLWARNVQQDENVPYLRYGAVIGVEGENTPDYVEILRACWGMLVRGPSVSDLLRGLLASAGLKYCPGGEVVERVTSDDAGTVVITDKQVYRGHAAATALVSVGDVLVEGQPIFDTVQVFEVGSGVPTQLSSLQALVLGPELANTVSQLSFPNISEDFQRVNGDARFTIFGNQADIDAFWASVSARGIAAGKTLAQCVGLSATSGPIPVNPMRFVIDNVFGANLILVLVKPEQFLARETGFLARVASLIPAGTLLLVQIELQTITDVLNLAGSPETIALYTEVNTATDVISTSGGNLTYTDYPPLVWTA